MLARRLSRCGVVVACVDYRNWPAAAVIPGMVDDVNSGVAYVLAHAAEWGGDTARVFLSGQSAGAHVGGLVLLAAAMAEAQAGGGVDVEAGQKAAVVAESETGAAPREDACAPLLPPDARPPRFAATSIAGFIGISGVYTPEDPELQRFFEHKGMDASVMHSIMGAGLTCGPPYTPSMMERASPVAVLSAAAPATRQACALLPPILLCHGTNDNSSPRGQTAAFAAALRAAGASSVTEQYYEGKTHTVRAAIRAFCFKH